jgi:hypothetical protein
MRGQSRAGMVLWTGASLPDVRAAQAIMYSRGFGSEAVAKQIASAARSSREAARG